MIKVITFLIASIISSAFTFGQAIYTPIVADPLRKDPSLSKQNYRIAETYIDTLSLPFFEDFTSPNASIDSIYFLDTLIRVTTLGHHGLSDKDLIYLSFQEAEASYLNTNHYVKAESRTSFVLYKDKNLQTLTPPGWVPLKRLRGNWKRPGTKQGPNPDTIKWVGGGGTYVNNTLGINPPSIYYASFDGLNGNGNPYLYSDAIGPIDQLTSLPVNIDGLNAGSDVVLSFYWQAGGYGNFPNRKDSLYLLLKDNKGAWNRVWGQKGGLNSTDSSVFTKVEIKITDAAYFYKGFQFRFQAVGNRGASNDNWNLDYIYMDKNWDQNKSRPRDRALSKSQNSLLKKYSSIPADHFLLNPIESLEDTISFQLKNLSNDIAILDFKDSYLTNGRLRDSIYVNTLPVTISKGQTLTYHWNVPKSNFPFLENPLHIRYIVTAFTSDPDKFNNVDFTTNNVDSTETYLRDYYAYDDGSAEIMGGAVNGGTLIFEFQSLQDNDTLTHIDIYIPASFHSQETYRQTMKLVYYAKDKISGRMITGKVNYNVGLNGFNRIAVDTIKGGIPLTSDIFYIGFTTDLPLPGSVNQYIPVGVDLNAQKKSNAFYRLRAAQNWSVFNAPGNFMIRPVFGQGLVTGVYEQKNYTLNCDVFPNPSSGMVTIEGEVNEITIYNISGKQVFNDSYQYKNSINLNLSSLLPGFYYLYLKNSKGMQTVKKLSLY